ncbi:MAG: hypothetical protein HYT03_01665 [Candidatus Harrisonbacteria bacterium]|nr:hypothetical protein [Candidatus Harrisonbacteria bacterium]
MKRRRSLFAKCWRKSTNPNRKGPVVPVLWIKTSNRHYIEELSRWTYRILRSVVNQTRQSEQEVFRNAFSRYGHHHGAIRRYARELGILKSKSRRKSRNRR